MSSEPNILPQPVAPDAAPRREIRPLYWSVRRELWENRSLYAAPLIVACVFLFGFLISLTTLPRRMRAIQALDPVKQHEAVTMPFSVGVVLLFMTAFLIGMFYCLEALQGERRDRSILFWKSLPVSDRTTVLAKAAIPFVVLPAIVFALAMILHGIMAVTSTIVLSGNSASLAAFWRQFKFFQLPVAFLYGLVAIALWHAPIYGWLLLISAWARRAAVLWALLPPLAIAAFEKMVFGTENFGRMIGARVAGWYELAFLLPQKGSPAALDPLAQITPLRYVAAPGLWLGLLFTVGCLMAAIRLRRERGPA